jgi:hypothetical protein
MVGQVHDSKAAGDRSRRTGGCAVLARDGMPAGAGNKAKTSAGNTGNTGNSIAGLRGVRIIQAFRWIRRHPVCAGGAWRKSAETPGREFAPETVGIFLTSAGGQRQGAARKPSAEIAGNAEVPPLGRRAIAYLIPVVLNEVTSTSFGTSTVRNEHKGLAFAPAACPQSTVEA